MNRDEKNLQTRQKIINSALWEFGGKSYGESSLNSICTAGNISKGIIYHYFKGKDELYLICAKECFDGLTAYLSKTAAAIVPPVEAALENYFDARTAFFAKNPLYLKLFCNLIMAPPAHLLAALTEIKAEFNALNLSALNKIIENVKLCSDVSRDDVIKVFLEYQDFINTRFQLQALGDDALKAHDELCHRSLKILLYGVVEREAKA